MGGGGDANSVRVKNARRVGRARRGVGWALIAVGLVVACLFVASRWWAFYWRQGTVAIGAASGQAFVGGLDGVESEWHVNTISPQYRGFRWLTDEPQPSILQVDFNVGVLMRCHTAYIVEWSFALWPWPVVLGSAGVWLMWSGVVARLRAVTGSCRACGYSLVGLEPDAGCPECGGKGA